jgi:hypothetical protein
LSAQSKHMGAACLTASRDSTYDRVQVMVPATFSADIRSPKIKLVNKLPKVFVQNADGEDKNVHAQVQELFEHVLTIFDIKSQKNAFLDVRSLISHFNDDLEVEKLSLKLTKHVFDHYDTNHNGYLEMPEIEPFCIDLLHLFGQEVDKGMLILFRC